MGLALPASPRPALRSWVHQLPDGMSTRVHVATHPLATVRPRILHFAPPRRLLDAGLNEAIVGGFFVRPDGRPLGELWTEGRRVHTEPWDNGWTELRSSVLFDAGRIAIAPRSELPERPAGDLLQAGPLLVSGGRSAIVADEDFEGFSEGSAQFDSDITSGRYPRAALGLTHGSVLAVACDGRAWTDAGMTLAEMADLMAGLGAHTALNLDGGGSTTLISGGRLRNRPREEHGIDLAGGRPISTAIAFC